MRGDSPAIAESFLRRSLEAIFDVGRHIIAKSARKGLVEYKEIPQALADIGIVNREQAERLKLMAGFRNRLLHFYHEVTDQELYQIINANLSDIEGFGRCIKTFLEHYKRAR